MKDRQGHLGGGLLLRGMHTGGNASPVVDDRHTPVDVDRHLDGLTEPRHVFVDTVVDDFVDEMVKSVDAGAPDVHCRALSHGIETLEDLDLIGADSCLIWVGKSRLWSSVS